MKGPERGPLSSLWNLLRHEGTWGEREQIRERLERLRETIDVPSGDLTFLEI
jgi:hypothetical protein